MNKNNFSKRVLPNFVGMLITAYQRKREVKKRGKKRGKREGKEKNSHDHAGQSVGD